MKESKKAVKKARKGSEESDWYAEYENENRFAKLEGDSEDEENMQFDPNDRTLRIPVSEIFESMRGIEDAGVDDSSSPPVVSKFQRKKAETISFDEGFEQGDLKYSPSRLNPYYMAIQHNQMCEMFGSQAQIPRWATETRYSQRSSADTAILSYFNVSLKLFYDLANDTVDWLSLSRLIDPQVAKNTDDEEKKEGEMLKEMAFGKLLDNPINDPLEGQELEELMKQPLVVPKGSASQMALEDPIDLKGSIVANINGIDAMWAREKEEIVQEISDKMGRRIYVPIRHQMGWLMWVRLGTWDKTQKGRRQQLKAIKKGFAKVWMTVTATDPESAAGYRARFSSADLGFPLFVVPEPGNLILRLDWPQDQVTARFQAYINKINKERSQDFTWMAVMKKQTAQDIGFIKASVMGENPFGLFTTYIRSEDFNAYMTSLEVLRGYADQNLTRMDAHRNSKTSQQEIKNLKDWFDARYQPMNELDDYTEPQIDVMSCMEKSGTITTEKGVKKMLYVKDGFESTWRIDVGSDKISDARGKRIARYAPAKIMGMPANEAAEHALGWKPLHRAEEYLGYVHRMSSGFFMAETYRIARFEKAWQTLVTDSPDFNRDKFRPQLTVTRNRKSKPVIRDVRDAATGNYSRVTSNMIQEEKQMAAAYHFLAYTISYSISFPNGCKLLNMGRSSSLETTFYPFLRPLYHKLEDQLDKVLYEEMKVRCPNDVQGSRDTLFNPTLSLRPYNQNGHTVSAGTGPYGSAFSGL
ncbi:hypothetical protein FLAG1_07119 [Fusarium langsethiae]|uniref:Uncharacterized protein n=1 Tax=Fusarium langsethiae TaxID=179993 RepID=A0A0M9EUP7_FUSLA|nr:hypothetical protein FLAG1_07119 [Fusarium langsethiae]GKU04420.1 unnamed protein product [Fusarium langsethiae]GKU20184.1 unnamed protein product [Fusarium langsethiae]